MDTAEQMRGELSVRLPCGAKVLPRAALALSIVGSAVLLVSSMWPGRLSDALFVLILGSCIWVPIAAIAGLVTLWYMLRRRAVVLRSMSPRPLLAAAALVFLTMGLVLLGVPLRIAFAFTRPSLQPLAEAAAASGIDDVELGRRCGPYFVDHYASDPRGGVYFRTHTGPDGISPDTMSYGFAFKPNDEGSPFGAAWYTCYYLSGDWYAFKASDDWY